MPITRSWQRDLYHQHCIDNIKRSTVGNEPEKLVVAVTHWGRYDAQTRGRGRNKESRALCGVWFNEHTYSAEPSCPRCKAALAESDKLAQQFEQDDADERVFNAAQQELLDAIKRADAARLAEPTPPARKRRGR